MTLHLPRRPSQPLAGRISGVSRRRFVQSAALAAAPWISRSALAAAGSLEAYSDLTSVKTGAKIKFFARDPLGRLDKDQKFSIEIVRVGAPDQTVWAGAVNLRNRNVPSDASANGCDWKETLALTVPSGWPSGLYYAAFGSGARLCCVPFVVAPARRTPGVAVLVQVPVTTAQAYNNYGGQSLYTFNSAAGVASPKVSFDRPHADPLNYGFDPWQPVVARWLAKNGIAADFCTSVDLHANPGLLSGYRLFVTSGHDEYWSLEMRDRLDAFVAAGGNAAIFGGNTCWFQARFEKNPAGKPNRTLVCYKSSASDPDTRAAYKTINWIDLLPPSAENSTFGLGWNLGASWTNAAIPRPDTPWVVQRAEHWAFEGAGLAAGVGFGGAYVGYEVDALDFRRGADGRPYPSGLDGTPPTLRVLALADASTWNAQSKALGGAGEKSGFGAIAIYSRGGAAGALFNAGATDWAYGLRPEIDGLMPTPLSRITLNVINRLSSRHVESADVRRWKNVQASGDGERYIYSTGLDAPAGASLDGLAFRAFAAPATNTVPVYRYKYPQANGDGLRYIYSLDPALGYGWQPDGVAFHAFSSEQPGTSAAVFQHHIVQANGDGWRFMYSPNLNEPGWTFDGVAFFAPSA